MVSIRQKNVNHFAYSSVCCQAVMSWFKKKIWYAKKQYFVGMIFLRLQRAVCIWRSDDSLIQSHMAATVWRVIGDAPAADHSHKRFRIGHGVDAYVKWASLAPVRWSIRVITFGIHDGKSSNFSLQPRGRIIRSVCRLVGGVNIHANPPLVRVMDLPSWLFGPPGQVGPSVGRVAIQDPIGGVFEPLLDVPRHGALGGASGAIFRHRPARRVQRTRASCGICQGKLESIGVSSGIRYNKWAIKCTVDWKRKKNNMT